MSMIFVAFTSIPTPHLKFFSVSVHQLISLIMNPQKLHFYLSIFGLIFLSCVIFTFGQQQESFSSSEPELVQVQILFRHGMRAPESPYPADPLRNESLYWPNGWGQLTQYGKEQQFNLGKYLRTRYNSLLSKNYNRHEIYVTSSDYDRTIMSAQLVLAGLYTETDSQYDGLKFESIPIHTIPSGSTKLMLHPSYVSKVETCPRYYKLMNEDMKKHPQFIQIDKENADLIEIVRNGTGENNSSKTWLALYGGHLGTIMIEHFYNFSIPNWAIDVLNSKEQMKIKNIAFAFLTITNEMKRLVGGPLIKEWLQNMDNKIGEVDVGEVGNDVEKVVDKVKNVYIYSGHDLTLVNVMNTMGLNDPPFVPAMGSSFMVELYKQEGNYTVKFFYRDGMSTEVKELSMPNCTSPCSLNTFKKLISPFLPDDLDKECNIDTIATASISVLDGILIGVICGLVVLLLGIQLNRFNKNRSKTYPVHS